MQSHILQRTTAEVLAQRSGAAGEKRASCCRGPRPPHCPVGQEPPPRGRRSEAQATKGPGWDSSRSPDSWRPCPTSECRPSAPGWWELEAPGGSSCSLAGSARPSDLVLHKSRRELQPAVGSWPCSHRSPSAPGPVPTHPSQGGLHTQLWSTVHSPAHPCPARPGFLQEATVLPDSRSGRPLSCPPITWQVAEHRQPFSYVAPTGSPIGWAGL